MPVKQAQAGDLLFYATDPSDPATIHHVVLYMGDGQMVEAPYSGEAVRARPVPWGYSELVPLATRPGTTPNRPAPDFFFFFFFFFLKKKKVQNGADKEVGRETKWAANILRLL